MPIWRKPFSPFRSAPLVRYTGRGRNLWGGDAGSQCPIRGREIKGFANRVLMDTVAQQGGMQHVL